ncbi:CdaR family protein [Neolewinella litorea]|nr:CdaR family protein [Neolewinella litorea]
MATTDRQMLLICIGLAFVFWLILNLSQDYEINKTVMLQYSVSNDRALAGTPPRSVPVQIRGRGWNLIWESMRGSEMSVQLDVGADEDYLLSRNVLEQEIRRQLTSGDLEIDNIGYDPQRILTTPRDGKRVPIISNVKASFGPGYAAVNGVTLQPDSVTVSGAIDELEEITSWPTEPLILEGLEESIRTSVALKPPPEGLKLNYDEIRLAVDVEAFIEQQFRIPVTLYNAPPSDSSRVFPPYVTVTATVPQRAFGTIRETDFRVEADLSRMKTNDPYNTVPLTLTRVPENISRVDFTPRAVEYYIYNRPQ